MPYSTASHAALKSAQYDFSHSLQGFRAIRSAPEPRRDTSRKRRRRGGFQQIASSHIGFSPNVQTANPISLNSTAQCGEQDKGVRSLFDTSSDINGLTQHLL